MSDSVVSISRNNIPRKRLLLDENKESSTQGRLTENKNYKGGGWSEVLLQVNFNRWAGHYLIRKETKYPLRGEKVKNPRSPRKKRKRSGREARGQWDKAHPAPKFWPPCRLFKHRSIEMRLIEWRRWICSLRQDYSWPTAVWRVEYRPILKENTSIIRVVKRGRWGAFSKTTSTWSVC